MWQLNMCIPQGSILVSFLSEIPSLMLNNENFMGETFWVVLEENSLRGHKLESHPTVASGEVLAFGRQGVPLSQGRIQSNIVLHLESCSLYIHQALLLLSFTTRSET